MRSPRPVSPFLTVNAAQERVVPGATGLALLFVTSGKHALGINFTGAFIVGFYSHFLKHVSLFSGISFALKPVQHLNEQRLYTVYSKPQKEEFVESQCVQNPSDFLMKRTWRGSARFKPESRSGGQYLCGLFDGLTGIIQEPPKCKRPSEGAPETS
jgi:hypothetical protein